MTSSLRRWLQYAFGPVVWDLWLVGLLALFLVALVLLPDTTGHPVRIATAVVFVLLVPGYALVSALFPEATYDEPGERLPDDGTEPIDPPAGDGDGNPPTTDKEPPSDEPTGGESRGIDGIERLAFGFGMSVALTALIALGLNFTQWGIRLLPLVAALTGFTAAMLLVAGVRRLRLLRRTELDGERTADPSPDNPEPYAPPFGRLAPFSRELRDEVLGRNAESPLEKVLTIALVVSILLAAASVGWALSTPRPGSDYTEFYLLTRGDEGELVAGNYPSNLTVGDESEVILTINNHEFETVTYTVEVRLRDPTDNRSSPMQTIRDIRLDHNTTWQEPLSLEPELAGERLRIEFLLYRDGGPNDDPYRRLHLIVNVSRPS